MYLEFTFLIKNNYFQTWTSHHLYHRSIPSLCVDTVPLTGRVGRLSPLVFISTPLLFLHINRDTCSVFTNGSILYSASFSFPSWNPCCILSAPEHCAADPLSHFCIRELSFSLLTSYSCVMVAMSSCQCWHWRVLPSLWLSVWDPCDCLTSPFLHSSKAGSSPSARESKTSQALGAAVAVCACSAHPASADRAVTEAFFKAHDG